MRSFIRVARRPRWIAALVLALGIAAGFAALGQWQLSRSFATATQVEAPDSETPVPLTSIAEPQSGVTEPQLGRRVTVEGELVAGELTVLSGRDNGSARGYWLIGHLVTPQGVSLAVALGWAADRDTIDAAAASTPSLPVDADGLILGRYLPSESPAQSDVEEGERSAMATPELINLWADPGPVYGGYLVVAEPVAGLEPIISPAPIREVELNLLNVFYAIEWALFAGFAVFLWWRVVRDVVEREQAEAQPASAVE